MMPSLHAGTSHRHPLAVALVAGAVGVFSWFFRFGDPGGSFAGLTDDHFFYLVRGWQILFGDLPVRDFVDHGAPLFYYVGAAVQTVFGRGTLPELAFCVSVLAATAALTYIAAERASGSLLAALAGTAFHVFLEPRFYNYPKVLVYAVAIPLLWRFADRPSGRLRALLAVVTAVGFLFRHDHGVFVAVAMGALLLFLTSVPWRDRVRHAVLYGVTTLALLTPYLAFVQINGGVVSYLVQANEWANRDRGRAPVVFPGVFDNPDGRSDDAVEGSAITSAIATMQDNGVAWTFYVELWLPLLVLAMVAVSRDGFRRDWPHARAKIAMVAVLALALDAGFLRSPLEARLADPSVPHAILIAWLLMAVVQLFQPGSLRPPVERVRRTVALPLAVVTLATLAILAVTTSRIVEQRIDPSAFRLERVRNVSSQLQADWRLESWTQRTDRPALIDLSMYVNACTGPTDRVLVQAYAPQVLALARRAFAGGHADLRPGFFKTDEAQQLTIARLQAHAVPIILLEDGDALRNFRNDFPLVTTYIDEHYQVAGTRTFERFGTTLLVRRDRMPTGTYAPFDWPCYGSNVVGG